MLNGRIPSLMLVLLYEGVGLIPADCGEKVYAEMEPDLGPSKINPEKIEFKNSPTAF